MGVISRSKRIINDFRSPTAIRHNHRYIDHVTGERFEIETVGRWVEITRLDADRRPDNSVRKEVMRRAIDTNVVEHDPEKCPVCTEADDV